MTKAGGLWTGGSGLGGLMGPGVVVPPPFTGDAFAAVVRSEAPVAGNDLQWAGTGDAPPGGWFNEPTVGPMTFGEGAAPWQTIIVGADMVVRIEFSAHVGVIVTPVTINVYVKQNGTTIGSATFTGTGNWDPYINLTLRTVHNGDIIQIETDKPGEAWGNVGSNGTYLRVGRGTFVWNSGGVTWVGP